VTVPVRIQLTGLSEAKANFEKLGSEAQKEIGRKALREAGWTLARPMRAATYTTFVRRTRAIRSGLGVAVQLDAKSNALTGYVEEYPQSIAGPATPFKALVRKRLGSKRRRAVQTTSIAFWWRFLEFGTGPRRSTRTPGFLRSGKIGSTTKGQLRQLKAVGRWQASASRGGIKSRSWVRPIFGAKAPAAIEAFRDTFLKLIDAANRIKECQGELFADRTSSATMRANQLRLWFASMAYVLLCALRRIALVDSRFVKASCGSIRLALLKIGALVTISVRRIKFAMASACPYQDDFRQAFALLTAAVR
jgi:hypothetical protein